MAVLTAFFTLARILAQAAETNDNFRASLVSHEKPYVLGANDLIDLKVTQEDDLTTHKKISKEGTVEIPMLGTVQLGGKTIDEARTMIREALQADYLVHPEVSLSIFEYAKRRYTVLGHVAKPGIYEFSGEETISLLQAIGQAGGYARLGDPKKITIQRITPTGKQIIKIDANAMAKDKKQKAFEIMPDDTITIGERLL